MPDSNMSERCQAEYVMSIETLKAVVVPIQDAHAKGIAVIVFSITGNIRNSLGVYSQRMQRGPTTDLLNTS